MICHGSDQMVCSFPFLNQTFPESFFNGENPFLDNDLISSQIQFSQQQFTENICKDSSNGNGPFSRKKESTRKNNKIHTSKGPRDRRMRLSLKIARSFFDLHDMLGFDKPSKTVEWLFAKSRTAIKELKEKYFAEMKKCTKSSDSTAVLKNCSDFEEKKRRKLRMVDRDSRYKARARARERTREKLIHRLQQSKHDSEANPFQIFDALQTRPEEIDSLVGSSMDMGTTSSSRRR